MIILHINEFIMKGKIFNQKLLFIDELYLIILLNPLAEKYSKI